MNTMEHRITLATSSALGVAAILAAVLRSRQPQAQAPAVAPPG